MAIICFTLLEGRTAEQKRQLARRVTAGVAEVLDVDPNEIRILIAQLAPDDYSVGGVTAAEREGGGVTTT